MRQRKGKARTAITRATYKRRDQSPTIKAVIRTLDHCHGNLTEAGRRLNVSRHTIRRMLAKLRTDAVGAGGQPVVPPAPGGLMQSHADAFTPDMIADTRSNSEPPDGNNEDLEETPDSPPDGNTADCNPKV